MRNPSHENAPSTTGHEPARGFLAGGVSGNTRLTAWTGLALLVLLFFEGLTLPAIRLLLVPHIFIGLLLIPPLLLKLASTGYRFIRYYTGSAGYRAAGPPALLLRLLAPVLVFSVFALLASGIMLMVVGPGDSPWRHIHTLAFMGWFCLMTVHVLAYAPRALTLAWLDRSAGGRDAVAGALSRQSFVLASILLGLAIAIALLPLDASWVHWVGSFRGDG